MKHNLIELKYDFKVLKLTKYIYSNSPYIINFVYLFQFVTQADGHAIDLVQRYDWYFVPVMNPDGYLYTWSNVSCILISEQSCWKSALAMLR